MPVKLDLYPFQSVFLHLRETTITGGAVTRSAGQLVSKRGLDMDMIRYKHSI